MVKVTTGGEYTAEYMRHGTKDGKPWQLLKIKSEDKSHKSITIWANNAPTGVHEGAAFKVDAIEGVKYTSKKLGDKWVDEVHVTATVHQTASREELEAAADASSSTFTELAGDDDELPF